MQCDCVGFGFLVERLICRGVIELFDFPHFFSFSTVFFPLFFSELSSSGYPTAASSETWPIRIPTLLVRMVAMSASSFAQQDFYEVGLHIVTLCEPTDRLGADLRYVMPTEF